MPPSIEKRQTMSEQTFHAAQFKAGQRNDWDNVATGWNRWWSVIERGAQQVSDRLVELAEVQPGHRVLDIATGIGEPAVTAARRTGPSGSVVATDQSDQMLAIAWERASSLGLQNVEFRQMDAETLGYPDASFDAVLCRWGLMFLPDLAGTLSRVHGLLSPDGSFATAIWSIPPKVPMGSIPMSVVQSMLDVPPPPEEAPTLFKLSAPGVLEKAFTQAGFTDVRSAPMLAIMEFDAPEDYTQMMLDMAAPIIALLDQQPVELREEILRGITNAAREYATPDGNVRMPNETVCVVGRW